MGSKFKVGDKIVIIEFGTVDAPIGELCEVSNYITYGNSYNVINSRGITTCVHSDRIKLVTKSMDNSMGKMNNYCSCVTPKIVESSTAVNSLPDKTDTFKYCKQCKKERL